MARRPTAGFTKGSMRRFREDLARAERSLNNIAEASTRETFLGLGVALIGASPIAEGNFAASWRPSQRKPRYVHETDEQPDEIQYHQQIGLMRSQRLDYRRTTQRLWWANGSPYAEKLERGGYEPGSLSTAPDAQRRAAFAAMSESDKQYPTSVAGRSEQAPNGIIEPVMTQMHGTARRAVSDAVRRFPLLRKGVAVERLRKVRYKR